MSVTSDGAAPAPRRSGRIGDGASFLLETLRARPAARRILSGVSVLLAVFAVGLLAYPMYTNLYQGRLQSKLAIQFNKVQRHLDVTPFTDQVKNKTTFLFPVTSNAADITALMQPVMDSIYIGQEPVTTLSGLNDQLNQLFTFVQQ